MNVCIEHLTRAFQIRSIFSQIQKDGTQALLAKHLLQQVKTIHLAARWPNAAFKSPANWHTNSASELSHTEMQWTGEDGRTGLGSPLPESWFLTIPLESLVLTLQVFSHQGVCLELSSGKHPFPWNPEVDMGHGAGGGRLPVHLAWAQRFPHLPSS